MGVNGYIVAANPEVFAAHHPERLADLFRADEQPSLTVGKRWEGILWLIPPERRADPLLPEQTEHRPTRALLPPHYAGVSYAEPTEVVEIADALRQIGEAELRQHFDPVAMHEGVVYPDNWDDEPELALADLIETFQEMREFYRGAASRGDYVLVLIE